MVSGVIEGISTVTEGQGESCVSYKVLHDTAGLAEEKRMPSPVPATHQKLTWITQHVVTTNYLKVKMLIIILWCPACSGPADHS